MPETRVFASVGTHPQQFDRLLKELDVLAKNDKSLRIFAQTGNSGFTPSFPHEKFLSGKEYEKKFRGAGIIVSHGGAGTIISALQMEKKLIIVPRLKKFGEHTNDHQLDLAKALEKDGKAVAVEDISGLAGAIETAGHFKPDFSSSREKLIRRISAFLESAEK
ncbi:MAG: hypothetical protein HY394_02015 [Candidatus Diapherotrites archaeon]|nr:hypothetical protein [Candidatus Diapherotrites archaeon]